MWYPAAARNVAQKPFPRRSSSNAYDMKDADAAKDGIFKETESVLCIKYTISEDMTKGEQARNKARLSAIADRPGILGSKRSSVLGFAHGRTGIEAHRNHATLLLKDRSGFFMSSRDDLQEKAQPLSPHNNTEWMALTAQELESRPGPKRMRPNTPPRSFSPQRDGIRKKNARFDIPPERSLLNIDVLIQNSTNADEIKELMQQRRLLKNRQAALDSRQRKKKQTEELKEEKKLWTKRVGVLKDEIANMQLQIDGLLREKEQWHHEQMEIRQIFDQLQEDKEELVRSHTLEVGELRKKVSVLTLSDNRDPASDVHSVYNVYDELPTL